jgi:serine/threonine-protein phosphatase with EF-hand domain
LWSDPKNTPGTEANVFRGGGCLFGPNITKSVIAKNQLSLIIRSHECKEQGYEYSHGDKLLTVFSASNYYEYGSNKGAYIRLMSAGTKPIIVQFQVKKESQENLKNASLRERVGGIELSAIKNLLEIFAANKNRLIQAYNLKDQGNSGAITLADWCTTTTEILNLNLPWRTLRPKLVQLSNEGLVLYESTFEGLTLPKNSLTVNIMIISFIKEFLISKLNKI